MTKRASRPRDETFWNVLNSALELDYRKGHLKWTMSELSRKSGITRSLIYYHFGRSKASILEEAVRVIGEEVIGLSPERMEMWKNGDWETTVLKTRQLCQENQSLANFYLLHRERPTEVGQSLQKIERQYLKKLETLFPHAPEPAHRALFAVFFGLVFAPVGDEASIRFALSALKHMTRPQPRS